MTDDDSVEQFAQRWEARHGLPPGGRDPDDVRHELACRRGACGLLLGRITGDRSIEPAAMAVILRQCFDRPGLTPSAAVVPVLVNIPASLLAGAARDQFVEELQLAGVAAAAELDELGDAADQATVWRDRAVEAAEIVLRARLVGDTELEARGWSLAEAIAAQHGTTAPAVVIEPLLTLIRDHTPDEARVDLIDKLRIEWALETPECAT